MELSEFASPTFIPQHGGMVEYGGGDKGQVAIFYLRPVHNPSKSMAAGRQIMEDHVYVRIHPPGERLNIIDRPARQEDTQRWPSQWVQFQQNKQQTPEGTPVEQLYPDRPSVGAMLRACHVYTIEQCAELSSEAIQQIGMGAQQYSNDAKKYIEVASRGVTASTMRRELEERDGQIRTLNQQITALKDELARLRVNSQNPEMLAAVQQMVAQAMGQPTFPAAQFGAASPPPAFDAQVAQINASAPTAQLAQAAKTKSAPRPRPASLGNLGKGS